MPYKYRTGKARSAYNAARQKMIALEIEKIIDPIAAVAGQVVHHQAAIAENMAKSRAPVRRVFSRDSGGVRRRITTRGLSIAELEAETPAFLRSLSPAAAQSVRDRYGPGVPSFRIGTRTTMGRNTNRANAWRATHLDRQVQFLPSSGPRAFQLRSIKGHLVGVPNRGSFVIASLDAGSRLNKEGLAALRHARLDVITVRDRDAEQGIGRLKNIVHDVGRGGLSVTPVESIDKDTGQIEVKGFDIRLGGNLRRSITTVDTSRRALIEDSVVAGGKTAPYAKYMEFGTRYVAARPFLRPALKHVEVRFSQKLRGALRDAGLLL